MAGCVFVGLVAFLDAFLRFPCVVYFGTTFSAFLGFAQIGEFFVCEMEMEADRGDMERCLHFLFRSQN